MSEQIDKALDDLLDCLRDALRATGKAARIIHRQSSDDRRFAYLDPLGERLSDILEEAGARLSCRNA